MHKFLLIFLLLLPSFITKAQQEVSLSGMQDIPNSVRFNPAFTTGYKWTISLPSISNSFVSNAPNINSIFLDNGGGSYTLNVAQAISKLSDQNYLANVNKLELFGISHQWKNSFVHLNLGVRTTFGLEFPKGLAELVAYGNGPFVDKTIKLGPSIGVQSYTEVGLGFSQKIGKIRIGATLKYLNGIASATSVKNDISLHTDPEYYQLTATTDYEVQSSSLVRIDSFGVLQTQFNQLSPGLVKGNKGIGYDLGIVFDVTDNFSISAAAVDLGKITWTKNAVTLSSKGTFLYEGVAVDGFSSIDSSSLDGILDSVQAVFNFKSKSGTFATPLARKYLIGATYRHGKATTLNGILDVTKYLDKNSLSFALSGRTYVKKWLAFGGVISYKNKEIDHLGLNTTLKLGPVQLYLISDNALGFIFPKTANDLHFRVGLNLVFGKIDNTTTRHVRSTTPTPHL